VLRGARAPLPTPPRASPSPGAADVNALQAALLSAVAREDYEAAAIARDALGAAAGTPAVPADWAAAGAPPWLADRAARLGFPTPTDVQRRAAAAVGGRKGDAVIISQTGSGKTLAFLVPALAAALADVAPGPNPRLVVVVPTRDLGVQVALLAFKLLGGAVGPRVPGAADNLFSYTGPRGVKVAGVLDEGEAERARESGLDGAAVVVGTPDLLLSTARPGAPPPGSTAVKIVVDEADAVLAMHGDALERLVRGAVDGARAAGGRRPDLVLVGATAAGAAAQGMAAGWLRPDAAIVLGGGLDAAVAGGVDAVSDAGGAGAPAPAFPPVPAGVSHSYVVVDAVDDELPTLARLLRAAAAATGDDAPPPRVVVFVRDAPAAATAGDALRSALWGVHTLAVLLPEGKEPVRAAAALRDGAATLLVATPPAARGLDLPSVAAVYSLGPPTDAADYLHRAGRAGRLGPGAAGGVAVSVVARGADERALLDAAASLGVTLTKVDAPPIEADVRKALDDVFWTRGGRPGGGSDDGE
jgi:superfamily II DNA/RNA helicase